MPDYEIKIWTYEMAKQIDIPYINEALSKHKWAFAADVVRLFALKKCGGVYMDSDVFVKKTYSLF
jgi:mannosyltransferase OCH1-like enzyme